MSKLRRRNKMAGYYDSLEKQILQLPLNKKIVLRFADQKEADRVRLALYRRAGRLENQMKGAVRISREKDNLGYIITIEHVEPLVGTIL
jgi:hypothetical protein